MARSSFLDRFRPLGAPGAAAPIGVAAGDHLEPAAELAPVFHALAPDIEKCRTIRDAARRDAENELARAREAAAAIVTEARLAIGAEQTRAATRVMSSASSRDAHLLEQARNDAAAIEKAGSAQLPAAVDKVLDAVMFPQPIQP